ncbi:calcium-binding protein [Donghicola eburneus]|uniref:calcium-binding protein n=1 Tax=Donghicola eburneus TaxID=393278 RepID=UPI0008E406BD|nr:calcium-binding protein [Donghicola eburneus]SFQ71321.1 Hemolysin-type calcium-binding repeat-containing protein [Donghicola eburneus]
MYYFTTFDVTTGAWDTDGSLVQKSYDHLTIYSQIYWGQLDLQRESNSASLDVGFLNTWGSGATYSSVSSNFLSESLNLGGDSAADGSPGALQITLKGEFYLAEVTDGGAPDDRFRTQVLEFEYTPVVSDGYRHTLLLEIEGDELSMYENYVSEVGPATIPSSGLSYDTWEMLRYYEEGGISEPDAPGINWRGDSGMDFVSGQDESDTLHGAGGNDWLNGGGGHDLLIGGTGDDTLFGDNGNDTLRGSGGSDWLVGSTGDDKLLGGGGADRIDGWQGRDLIQGGAGSDEIDSGGARDKVRGNGGRDTIKLGTGSDKAYGGKGDDNIFGEQGNDLLLGQAGRDTLHGGAGNDSLYGGSGGDTFIYSQGSDIIYDAEVTDLLIIEFDGLTNDDIRSDLDSYATEFESGVLLSFSDSDTLEIRDTTMFALNMMLV